jgi:hypothetical protein
VNLASHSASVVMRGLRPAHPSSLKNASCEG